MPKSASTRIRLPIQTVPPRGITASPNTVMISDPARIVGRALNSATSRSVALFNDILDRYPLKWVYQSPTVHCDTVYFNFCFIVYLVFSAGART